MPRIDDDKTHRPPGIRQKSIRWLLAAGLLLLVGTLLFAYYGIDLYSNRPRAEQISFGLQYAGGNSLLFLLPAALIAGSAYMTLTRRSLAWRRLFLVLATLNLLWTLATLAVGVGVLFVPAAVCGLLAALSVDLP